MKFTKKDIKIGLEISNNKAHWKVINISIDDWVTLQGFHDTKAPNKQTTRQLHELLGNLNHSNSTFFKVNTYEIY